MASLVYELGGAGRQVRSASAGDYDCYQLSSIDISGTSSVPRLADGSDQGDYNE